MMRVLRNNVPPREGRGSLRTGQARKRDTAEKGIVEALRALGARVIPLSGKDAPDLLVCYRGRWFPVEVKTGKGRVTAGQQAAGYPIVRTLDEVLALVRETP